MNEGADCENGGISASDPDLLLVRALQAGNENALAELMQKHSQPLFRLVYRYAGDAEETRDIVQETFVRVYFNIGRFKPTAKFVTWLYSIAINLCRDYARSARWHQVQLTRSFDELAPGDQIVAPAPTPAQEAELRERLAVLQNAIAELPHDLRVAIILFALEGRSQHECAEMLGVSAKTVETRVYRARKRLENEVRESL